MIAPFRFFCGFYNLPGSFFYCVRCVHGFDLSTLSVTVELLYISVANGKTVGVAV